MKAKTSASRAVSCPGGIPEGTDRNMPTTAVNTISATTRGLVSSKYSRARTAKGRRVEVRAVGAVFMVILVRGLWGTRRPDDMVKGDKAQEQERRHPVVR